MFSLEFCKISKNTFSYRPPPAASSDTHNESYMQEHLFKHFNIKGQSGFLSNVSITFIDKIDGKNTTEREGYWKRTSKIYSTFGINVEGNVQKHPSGGVLRKRCSENMKQIYGNSEQLY